MQHQPEPEESKESKHISHDTADAVLDIMEEFAIPGDELKEPKKESIKDS